MNQEPIPIQFIAKHGLASEHSKLPANCLPFSAFTFSRKVCLHALRPGLSSSIYLCMLIYPTKLTKFPFRSHVFNSPFFLSSVSFLSTSNHPSPEETTQDATFLVSSLIKKPNWEKNSHLISLVSRMSPLEAFKVIQLHTNITKNNNNNDINLVVRFFNWVCNQSTYCYDLDSRIDLLNLIVFSNLFGVAHKVIIALIKECISSSSCENDILKLMDALDELRKFGFRLNYPCYSSLLMGLAKVNLGFVAFLVYKRMVADGFVVGGIDYKTMINGLCKNGFVQGGEMFFCRMLKLGFDLDTHISTSLVLGYCRDNDLPEAFRVFDIMSKIDGCGPNSITYSTLIHGLCEEGKLDEAFGLKNEMSEKGFLPSTHTYTILIKAMCDSGAIAKAFSLLDEMVAKGSKPNVHTYTVLIDGLCGEGKIEEANGMFRRMLQDGLFPSIVTYNALINGYCKEGNIVLAFDILSLMEIKNCKPNICTYNELMEGLCRVNKSSKAMSLLRKMVENGLLPDRVTYNILVDGFCKEGQLEVAFKILMSMKLFGLQPDAFTYTAMIDGLCKCGRPDLANGLFGLMMKKGIFPDEIAFTALMDGYCKIGKIGEALMLCGWMMECIPLKSSHAFNVCLDILCKENRLKEEYAMFGKILRYGLVPSVVTYTILINGLCRVGDVTHALHILELMKCDGCSPNVYTYTVVINGLCQNGRVEEAEKLLFGMSDLGVPPNHITYSVLVKAHANAGRLGRALDIVSTMVQNGCHPNNRIYSALLAGLASLNAAETYNSAGHMNASSLTSEENDDVCTPPDHVLKNIDVEVASELGDKIETCGGSATDFYNLLAVSLCREGRIIEADHLVRDKLKRGLFPYKAFSSIIEWHCKEQRYDHCLEFMKLILSSGFVPSLASFWPVIQGLHDEGKGQQAQSLVSNLLRCNRVDDKTRVLPYIEFLVKGDTLDESLELLKLIEQLHHREKPVV